jgi:multidrug efflux pump subunit AcrA (membrane-fusion protein)
VVIRRTADPGVVAGPPAGDRTEPLLVVASLDPVRVVVAVPESAAVRLGRGARAVVRVEALGGRRLEGKVSRTARALDPRARTLRAEIDLPNPAGRLPPGLLVTVTLTLEPTTPGK